MIAFTFRPEISIVIDNATVYSKLCIAAKFILTKIAIFSGAGENEKCF